MKFDYCQPKISLNLLGKLFLEDLFLKNKEDNKYYDNLLKAFTKGKFFDNLGLRNKEIDFKINDKTHAPEIISTIEK